jgi:hypothetical protein
VLAVSGFSLDRSQFAGNRGWSEGTRPAQQVKAQLGKKKPPSGNPADLMQHLLYPDLCLGMVVKSVLGFPEIN